MSKVDIKAHIKGIKLFLDKESVRKTDNNYFIMSEYPVCELFDSDAPVTKETVFLIPKSGSDTSRDYQNSVDIVTLINNSSKLVVNATVWHGMYGTVRMEDIEVTDVIP